MKVEIDLLTDTVLRASPFLADAPNVFSEGVPPNYDLTNYDYIPSTSGVYDPNGWYPVVREQEFQNELVKRFITTANTNTSGQFTVTFPTGLFTQIPHVSLTIIASNTRPHAIHLTSLSLSSCSGLVKRSRLLPTTITTLINLQSYDVFQNPGVVQVQINAMQLIQ